MSVSLLSGETVQFKLSPDGVTGLSGIFDGAGFEAFVTSVDDLGVWVDFGNRSAMLLKWQYIATLVVPLRMQEQLEPESRKIGF
jgi:hypothetical protein